MLCVVGLARAPRISVMAVHSPAPDALRRRGQLLGRRAGLVAARKKHYTDIMSASILLVNPPIHDFAAYDFFNKPLGLLYLASYLRQEVYQVRLIDALDRRHPALAGRFAPHPVTTRLLSPRSA